MDKTGLLVIGVNLLIYAAYFTGVFLFSEQGITAAIRSFSLRKGKNGADIYLDVPVGVTAVSVFRLAMPKSPNRNPCSFRKSPS